MGYIRDFLVITIGIDRSRGWMRFTRGIDRDRTLRRFFFRVEIDRGFLRLGVRKSRNVTIFDKISTKTTFHLYIKKDIDDVFVRFETLRKK